MEILRSASLLPNVVGRTEVLVQFIAGTLLIYISHFHFFTHKGHGTMYQDFCKKLASWSICNILLSYFLIILKIKLRNKMLFMAFTQIPKEPESPALQTPSV